MKYNMKEVHLHILHTLALISTYKHNIFIYIVILTSDMKYQCFQNDLFINNYITYGINVY